MTATAEIIDVLFELQKKRQEDAALEAQIQERKQKLETKKKQTKEADKELVSSRFSIDSFVTREEKPVREMGKKIQKDEEIERLKKEKAELMEKKQKLELHVQRYSVYWDILEQVRKRTKFEDLHSLVSHMENQLHVKAQLYQRQSKAEEQVNEQTKALVAQEDLHALVQIEMINKLSDLHTKQRETHSEAQIWEKKWDQIQETATKKILLLGELKMAIFCLYEMTGHKADGAGGVDMNDTEKQLDRIKRFMQIIQHENPSHRHDDGQSSKTDKKHIASHSFKF